MQRDRERAPGVQAANLNMPRNRDDRLGDIADQIGTVRLYSMAIETLAAAILKSCLCPPGQGEPLLALQQLVSHRLASIAETVEQEAGSNAP